MSILMEGTGPRSPAAPKPARRRAGPGRRNSRLQPPALLGAVSIRKISCWPPQGGLSSLGKATRVELPLVCTRGLGGTGDLHLAPCRVYSGEILTATSRVVKEKESTNRSIGVLNSWIGVRCFSGLSGLVKNLTVLEWQKRERLRPAPLLYGRLAHHQFPFRPLHRLYLALLGICAILQYALFARVPHPWLARTGILTALFRSPSSEGTKT